MKTKNSHFLYVISIIGLCNVIAGCGSTKATKGATGGAAAGAVAGGLLGGWRGAAVGAAVGTGVGYIAGNEADKKQAREETARERAALAQSQVTSDPKTAYRPPNKNPLVGSTWRVISVVSDEPYPEYSSMVVTFQTNSKMTTLVALKDGSTTTIVETYRVVDDVLVITGKDYVVNGKFSIDGQQMIFVAPEIRTVLEEIEEQV
jgi:uncharacterized protein YcfJ